MKPRNRLIVDTDYWILAAPGLVMGILVGLGIGQSWLQAELIESYWLSVAFAVTSVTVCRSLVMEAAQELYSLKEDSYYRQLTMVQVPMLLCGLLLALSMSLVVSQMSDELQRTVFMVLSCLSLMAFSLRAEAGATTWLTILTAIGLLSVGHAVESLEQLGYLESLIQAANP